MVYIYIYISLVYFSLLLAFLSLLSLNHSYLSEGLLTHFKALKGGFSTEVYITENYRVNFNSGGFLY